MYLGLQQNNECKWYFLGILKNDRPSAIYKIGNLTKCMLGVIFERDIAKAILLI